MGAALVAFARGWVLQVIRHLGASDYLAGMFAMSAMGVARDGVGVFCVRLLAWLSRKLWVTIRLKESDAELLLVWLRERPEVSESSNLCLFTRGNTKTAASPIYEYEPELQASQRVVYKPDNGRGRARWVWISRKEHHDLETPSERRLRDVTVCFFGRDKGILEEILESGRLIQRRRREKHLTVVQVYDYANNHGLDWLHPQESDRKQPGRSIASVVLPRAGSSGTSCSSEIGPDQAEALLEDAREFLASEAWYTERGIPYRRGYLLHGLPGGGKSSLVVAVASELRMPIYALQLSSELMNDETLNALLQHGMHDPPTILLLEDVDLLHTAALRRGGAQPRKEAEKEEEAPGDARSKDGGRKRKGGKLTLSGLLNALDGPIATTGRLLFMTTNARSNLDPALIRSGRIDYEVEFKPAVREQIERLFMRFYSDFKVTPATTNKPCTGVSAGSSSSIDGSVSARLPSPLEESKTAGQSSPAATLAAQFAEKLEASGVELTTADIQRHLMKHKKDPDRAVQDVPTLIELVRSVFAAVGKVTENVHQVAQLHETRAANNISSGGVAQVVSSASAGGVLAGDAAVVEASLPAYSPSVSAAAVGGASPTPPSDQFLHQKLVVVAADSRPTDTGSPATELFDVGLLADAAVEPASSMDVGGLPNIGVDSNVCGSYPSMAAQATSPPKEPLAPLVFAIDAGSLCSVDCSVDCSFKTNSFSRSSSQDDSSARLELNSLEASYDFGPLNSSSGSLTGLSGAASGIADSNEDDGFHSPSGETCLSVQFDGSPPRGNAACTETLYSS